MVVLDNCQDLIQQDRVAFGSVAELLSYNRSKVVLTTRHQMCCLPELRVANEFLECAFRFELSASNRSAGGIKSNNELLK